MKQTSEHREVNDVWEVNDVRESGITMDITLIMDFIGNALKSLEFLINLMHAS